MRNALHLIIIPLLLLTGCSFLEEDLPDYRSRNSCQRRVGEPNKNESPGPSEGDPASVADTSFFVSAVRCSPGYDWRRDIAYGAYQGELVLYRNGKPEVTVAIGEENGASADPDMHHIIGGHLYTEYSTPTETIIGMDGTELLRFGGREFLKGLIVKGGDIHTLSQRRSGQGFSYRINGECVVERAEGTIFGSMGDPAYGPCGALYECGGRMCFAYSVRSGSTSRCYTVEDGVERAVSRTGTGAVLDVKVIPTGTVSISENQFGRVWSSGRIWADGYGYVICGDCRPQAAITERTAAYHSDRGVFKDLGVAGSLVFYLDDGPVVIDRTELDENYYLFSNADIALLGSEAVMALTPRGDGSPSVMRGEKKIMEFGDLNGFLTGLEIIVTPPTK